MDNRHKSDVCFKCGSCEIEYQTRRFKDGLFYEGYYCEDCGHEGVFTSKFLSNE